MSQKQIRGKDEFGEIRYDEETGEVLTRCSSCNMYRKRSDFPNSLFRVCTACRDEDKRVREDKIDDGHESIHDYIGMGIRRDMERSLWRFLKDILSPKKRVPGTMGRPTNKKARERMVREVIAARTRALPKKYRAPLMRLIANNALPPAQLMWLAFRPGLLSEKILRLSAVDTAREVVASSDLQEICDVGYFYDDAEHIARFPDSAVASQKAQKDLRTRVAAVAKQLSKHRRVLMSTWDAYDALLCVLHPGSKKAAESTAYHYIKIQTRIWKWHPERALRKLTQIYARRIEEHEGVSSDAGKAGLAQPAEQQVEQPAQGKLVQPAQLATSYWVSCSQHFPEDRYLACIEDDEKKDCVILLVFHNPKNTIEIGRKVLVPRTQLEPGPEGYLELFKEDLEAQGVTPP